MKTALRLALLLLLFSLQVALSQINWQQTNGPYGGSVSSFAVSGTNLFAGSTVGGVFLSTNNGTSWTAVNTGLTNTNVYSLAVSGTNLFAGTWNGGVFLSTNNGSSWISASTGLTNVAFALAVSGTNLFAGTFGSGVFLSTNNGSNWTTVNTGLTNLDVKALAVSGTNLFAGTADGVFLSTNNGASWNAVNAGLTNINVLALAVSGTNLFAGTNGGGVFLSTNNGSSWTAVNAGLTYPYVDAFVISGTNLFAGTYSGVFLSTNNGTSWTAVNAGLTSPYIYALTFFGANLFAGTGGGVFLSSNNGTSWTDINAGLINTDILALAVSGTNLFAGANAGGGGGVYLSTNNGTSWTEVNVGLTNTTVMSLALNGANLFAGTTGGVYLSTNKGTSWTTVNDGLTKTNVNALAVSGANLFAGTWGAVFLSTNNGTSWNKTSNDLASINVSALAVSGTHLFAGTWGGVYLSNDNGTGWSAVSTGLTVSTVSALIVSGTNLFAGTNGGVYLSTNNGTSWTAVNDGLTNTIVNALAVSGANLFAGTDDGVFLSTNNGTSWSKTSTGLMSTKVRALTVSGTHLFAGTEGSGVFIGTIPTIIAPTITSFTPTLNALNIAANTNITMTFNVDIDCSTITNNTVRINGSLSGLHPMTSSYNYDTFTATMTPNTPFKVGEMVSVTITRGIKTMVGDSLATSCSWCFTVKTNACSRLFYPNSTVAAGNAPWYLAAADLNGDSAIDLAVVNKSSNDVSILKNNGKGIFTKTATIGVGNSPTSITTADLDGDGDMDLVVTNYGSNTISILKNDGIGSFTLTSTVSVPSNPCSVTAADLDGNGTIDLAVAHYYGAVSILKNDGSGSFTLASTVAVGSGANSVTPADVNGDGAIDLVVTNYGSNTISILTNNGNGIFTQTAIVNVGNNPVAAAAADLDGDGSIDLAIANIYSNTLSILKNNGKGTFTLTSTVNAGYGLTSVIALDPDGNGIADLAVVNSSSGTVSIWQNSGSGSFTQTSTASSGTWGSPRIVIAADLDGDGCIDLATANSNLNSVTILTRSIGAPQNLTTSAGNAQATLQWNKNTEADFLRYRIYRGTSSNPTTKVDSTVGGITDTIKVYNGLTNGTTYYFRVTAVDSSGLESGYSNEVSVKPIVPIGSTIAIPDVAAPIAGNTVLVPINVTNLNNVGAISLIITYNSAVVTYVGVANDILPGGVMVGPLSPNGEIRMGWFDMTAITPLNIDNGKLVDLKFTYIGGMGLFTFYTPECDIANEMGITITGITYQSGSISGGSVVPPAAPTNLIAVAGNGQVTLYWNKNTETDFLKYRVYIGIDSVTMVLKDSSTASILDTLKTITNLTNGTKYYFRITALDNSGLESGFSNEVNATPTIDMNFPTIVSIKDVPYDQGGKVSLVWSASASDTNVNILPCYSIWRSSPERLQYNSSFKYVQEHSKSVITNIRTMAVNGIIYSWECISTQPAHRFSTYSFTAATLYDSMSTTSGKHYFMISALTNNPNVFYDSKIDSGYSVDNLPPLSPQNLVGNIQSGKIVLHWEANIESDLLGYAIYRNSNISQPDTLKAFAFTTDTSFIDSNPMMDLGVYYYVKAKDIHENLSKTSNQISLKTTNIFENNDIPTKYSLNQNYPNPFNPSTNIGFSILTRSFVLLRVFDLMGREVTTLINQEKPAGTYHITFDAGKLPSGVYFYRLQAGSFTETKKLLLLR